MSFDQRLLSMNFRLVALAEKFKTAVGRYASATPVPTGQEEAARLLRELSQKRASLLCTEVDEVVNTMSLTQERLSLLFRYRKPIMGENIQEAVSIIINDLNDIEKDGDLAVTMLHSAQSFNPAIETQAISGKISTSLNETTRINQALMAGPLSEEEESQFYCLYETPKDPILAYNFRTNQLVDSMFNLFDITEQNIDNTSEYVAGLSEVVMPSFPDHAAGLKIQAEDMLSKGLVTLQRAQKLLQQGEHYHAQLK